jgi:predicted small metal-binding protein
MDDPAHSQRRLMMAKSLACADAGMDCRGKFTTETEEELIKHIQLHAAEAHPDLDLTPELAAQIKTLVKEV